MLTPHEGDSSSASIAAQPVASTDRVFRTAVSQRRAGDESLIWSGAFVVGGNVIYAAGQWALISILVKFGGLGVVGDYALSMSLIAPVIAITGLNLRAVEATDAGNAYEFGEYFGLRVASALVGFGITCIAASLVMRNAFGFAAAVAGFRFFETLFEIPQGLFQKHNRQRYSAVSLTVRTILATGLMFVVMWRTHAPTLAWWTMLLALPLVLLFIDLRLAVKFEAVWPCWNKNQLKLAKLSAPLGIGAVLGALHYAAPRYFLGAFFDTTIVGLFAVLIYLVNVGNIVATAVASAVIPRAAALFHDRETERLTQLIGRVLVLDLALFAAATVASVLAGTKILAALYSTAVAQHEWLLPWVCVAAFLTYIDNHLGSFVTAMRVFRPQVAIQTTRLIVLVVLCLILIPWLQAFGAVLAIIGSMAVSVVWFGRLAALHINSKVMA